MTAGESSVWPAENNYAVIHELCLLSVYQRCIAAFMINETHLFSGPSETGQTEQHMATWPD